MRKIKVVVLLVRQLQHGFTKNAKVSPNLTVAHYSQMLGLCFLHTSRGHFTSPRDSLESRSLSPEASRLPGSVAGGGCITLKTKTR